MWIVVGLGNPGQKYTKTRHNAGFMVVDELSRRHGFSRTESKLASTAKGSVRGAQALLVEPLTFMNRSGQAVSHYLRYSDATLADLIVIQDDIDMDVGKLKLRRGGSSGGHRGIASIIEHIGSQEFMRVKIGIGRSADIEVERFVLSTFKPIERPLIDEAIIDAADAVESIMLEGLDKAMLKFNKRK